MEKEVIIDIINKNIKTFDVFEFCPNGGWPNFDELDVNITNIKKEDSGFLINLSILYYCENPGSCFAGNKNAESLYKKIFIYNDLSMDVLD